MFIAHIPAGYLATNLLVRKQENRRGLLAVGLLCSILPDFDLLWFYLVDNRQTVHHEYLFHMPLFWISLALAAWFIAWIAGLKEMRSYIVVALVSVLLHLLLDSFAAEIYWLRPFSDVHLNLIEVPARFGWWVWNFIFHWTFAAELAIVAAAAIVWWRRTNGTSAN